MSDVWRFSFRNLIGHKMRLVTTGLAVVIGVAFLTGTLVLRDTMTRTFDDLFAGVYRSTDALVRSAEQFEDPSGFGTQRARIDEGLADVVTRVDGVEAVQVDVTGYAQLVDKDGDLVGNPQNGPPTVGGNWADEPRLNVWNLIAGRAPATDDEVVIDRRTAEVSGYHVGDTATVVVIGPPRTVRVVGIAVFGKDASTGGASFVLFTTAAAQRYVGEVGKVSSIAVAGADGVSQASLAKRIAAALPDGTEAVTGAVITRENQDLIEQGLSVFNTFMLVFAFVALLVGAYIVFNTFSITVAQRSRENALLRALGASAPQVLVSVLVEAAGVAVVASVLGLLGGFAVAGALKALLVAIGLELPVSGVVFRPMTAVLGLAAGLVVTVGAAIIPARKASHVPPIAAMRMTTTGQGGYGSRQRVFVGFGVLAFGIGALAYGLLGETSNGLAIVGVAALAVFLAVTILGRTIALPLSRVIGWPIAQLRGFSGRLARENAMRNPRRTAATASALMIGVGLVSFITIFASSTKASIGAAIDSQFRGDFAITTPAMAGDGGLDPSMRERIAALPEVAAAGAVRVRAAVVDGTPIQLMAGDPGSFEIFDVQPRQGDPSDLGPTSIGVFEDVARDKGLRLGDVVDVRFLQTGVQQLTVDLIYGEDVARGGWILPMSAFERNVVERYDFQVFVKKAPGVSASAATAAVQRVVDDYPNASLLDQTAYKAEQGKFVDQMLGLVYALLALAIVIALLGIGNTLALSILERIHELGVLRAVGMTRNQLRAAVRWESVIIAVQGAVLGLVIGLFLGWALVSALGDQGLTTLAVPYPTLAVVMVLGAVAGLLAAVLPSRRAARIDVLRAVAAD